MAKGTVKWFNNAKGYGFITADGNPQDIFVHHTSIQAEGFRTLNEGESVEFELIQGLKAENVVKPVAQA